jgi:hypothetical protein
MQPRSLPTRRYTSMRCYVTNSYIGKSVHLLFGQAHVYAVGRLLVPLWTPADIVLSGFSIVRLCRSYFSGNVWYIRMFCLFLALPGKNAGRALSLRVIPWHLPNNWGEKHGKNLSQGSRKRASWAWFNGANFESKLSEIWCGLTDHTRSLRNSQILANLVVMRRNLDRSTCIFLMWERAADFQKRRV